MAAYNEHWDYCVLGTNEKNTSYEDNKHPPHVYPISDIEHLVHTVGGKYVFWIDQGVLHRKHLSEGNVVNMVSFGSLDYSGAKIIQCYRDIIIIIFENYIIMSGIYSLRDYKYNISGITDIIHIGDGIMYCKIGDDYFGYYYSANKITNSWQLSLPKAECVWSCKNILYCLCEDLVYSFNQMQDKVPIRHTKKIIDHYTIIILIDHCVIITPDDKVAVVSALSPAGHENMILGIESNDQSVMVKYHEFNLLFNLSRTYNVGVRCDNSIILNRPIQIKSARAYHTQV
jgi:hypothetical protein